MNSYPETRPGEVLTRGEINDYRNRRLSERLFISPLLDEETQIGACSVDLRLGLDFLVSRRSRMAVLDLNQEEHEIETAIRKYQESLHINLGDPFMLHPQQSVLGSTLEYIRIPPGLMSYVVNRSSWGRLGIHTSPAAIFPGFAGTITLTLTNQGDIPIVLRPGFRIAQLILHKTTGRETNDSRYLYATESAFSLIHKDPDLRLFGPRSNSIVVGIVSTVGAGRTEVIRYLIDEQGFKHASLSEIVREEARNSGIDQVRAQLQHVGNRLRKTYGSDVLARRSMERLAHVIRRGQHIVLDGIKHPDEVRTLRSYGQFYLLAIDAPEDVRYDRIQKRRRANDPRTSEAFQELDRRDRGLDGLEYGQKVDVCIKMADFTINNTGTIEDLMREIRKALNNFFGEAV